MDTLGGLITDGLGLDATQGLITMKFGVFSLLEIIVIPATGGGPYPHPNAWNVVPKGKIGDFYKPITEQVSISPPFYNLIQQTTPMTRIIISLRINKKLIEKNFLVRNETAKKIIKVFNFLNKQILQGSVNISNIKSIFGRIKVSIKNLLK